MNIVIVGCGNVGFATARRLGGDHTLLLVNRSRPPDLTVLLQEHRNVSFALADATDPPGMKRVIDGFVDKRGTVDALVSTVGAFGATTAVDDFDEFASNFGLNFFGNLIPIQAVLNHMIAARAGRIVVLSSTSGVFAYPGLTAYAPAKWALTSLCRTLRNEVRPYGVSVDIVFPASIRNQRSRTFLYQRGIDVEAVAGRIGRLLRTNAGSDCFVPRRYALLRPLERFFPLVLDRRAGLDRNRTKRFRGRKIDRVLVVGASSAPGRELAALYARGGARLYLVGSSAQTPFERNERCDPSVTGRMEVVDLDLTDSRAVERFADEIPGIDLLLNIVDGNVAGRIEDTPPTVFASGLETCFLGPARLTAALLRKGKISSKIVTILSVSPFERRPGWGCRAAGQSALWAFNRALRRTVGREIQVMEVVPAAWPAGIGRRSFRVGTDSTDEALARRIVQSERSGKEIVAMPAKAESTMCPGAATASVCEAAGMADGYDQIENHRFY